MSENTTPVILFPHCPLCRRYRSAF